MLPLLSFHALAAQRGDGLRPELLALMSRCSEPNIGLSARFEAEETEHPRGIETDASAKEATPK